MDIVNASQSRGVYRQRLLWFITLALIVRTTVLVRKRDVGAFASIDVYALFEVLAVGLALLMVLISPKLRKTVRTVRLSSAKYLFVYYGLCLISTLWSFIPKYTAFRSAEMVILTALVCLIMICYEEFFWAERAYLYIALFTVFCILVMQLRLASWQITMSKLHTNQYSAIAAMGFAYCVAERFSARGIRKRFLSKLAIVFGLFVALGTSATSNIAAFLSILVVLAMVRVSKPIILFFSVGGLLLLYLMGNFQEVWMEVLFPGKTEHEILTLKGRRYIWEVYLSLIADKPIMGYGFAVISRIGRIWGTVSTTHTHNGFFEVILGTGMIGSSLFVIWLIGLCREVFRSYKKNLMGAVGIIGALIAALVNNIGRSMMGGAFDAPSLMFLLLIAFFIIHIHGQPHEPAQTNRRIL